MSAKGAFLVPSTPFKGASNTLRCGATKLSMCAAPERSRRTIVIYGGGSTLGAEVVARFSTVGWRVVTLDVYDATRQCGGVNGCALPDSSAPLALALPAGAPAATQCKVAVDCLRQCGVQADVVLNATLGYAPDGEDNGGPFDAWTYMQHTQVESALIAVTLARHFLKPRGLLALLGSVAALSTTRAPGLLAFSCAKAAVHCLVHQLAVPGAGLPPGATAVALVPQVLDTPLHRAMSDSDAQPKWTRCEVLAEKLVAWAERPHERPPSGALVSVNTELTDDDVMQHQFRIIEESNYVQLTSI